MQVMRTSYHKKPLTEKQQKFITEYIRTGSGTRAVMNSYNTTNRRSATAIAHNNLDNTLVRQEIITQLEKKGTNLTNKRIFKDLSEIIEFSKYRKATTADALRAIEMVLRLKDLFPAERKAIAKLSYRAELTNKNRDELLNELRELRGKAKDIIT